MTKVDKVDKLGGNTKTPNLMQNTVEPSEKQVRRWCFTENNPEVDKVDILLGTLGGECTKYVFSVEIGKSGTRHYQGYLEFKNGRKMEGVKRLLPRAHLEHAVGDWRSNLKYCTKAPVEGPWSKGMPDIVKSEISTFLPWQAEAYKLFKSKPDARRIHWYWDEKGNVGKTAFAKHLCLEGETLFVSGKGNDIKCAIAQWHAEGKPLKAVIWGIPREKEDYMCYSALEEIKDGIFFSGKYESAMVILPKLHVFVFCNFAPELKKLSMDRWDIHRLDDVEL